MAFTPDEAVEELLRVYGEEELGLVRELIGSSTLRAAARLVIDAQAGQAAIVIPHYWAVFYHDGRPGFEAPAGRSLVFFANPADDPRLDGGRPVTLDDVRHLTPEEFRAGLDANEEAAAAGGAPFMFVLRAVGPAAPHPFFDQLAEGAAGRMDPIALAALDAFVQEQVDAERPEKRTIDVRI